MNKRKRKEKKNNRDKIMRRRRRRNKGFRGEINGEEESEQKMKRLEGRSLNQGMKKKK